MATPFSLTANERLKRKKDIDTLFLHGKAFFVFPYKVVYRLVEKEQAEEEALRFGVSVPKKSFKRAVDRNKLKRRTREIYRVNKSDLKQQLNDSKYSLHFMLLYNHKEILSSKQLTPSILAVLKRLGNLPISQLAN